MRCGACPVRARIVSEIDAGLWSTTIDLGQLSNVLLNLVIDARDPMTDGGAVTIRAVRYCRESGSLPCCNWTGRAEFGVEAASVTHDTCRRGRSATCIRETISRFVRQSRHEPHSRL
jgi:hypothetical protein